LDHSHRNPFSRTKGGGGANDNSLALDLLGEVDLVTRRVLDEDVQVGDGVALLDEVACGAVEGGDLDAGESGGETAGEHDGSELRINKMGIEREEMRERGRKRGGRRDGVLLMFLRGAPQIW
jgi:hypothetical protein